MPTTNRAANTMREQIKKLLTAVPFQAFAVEVAADLTYSVLASDHAFALSSFLVTEDVKGCADLVPFAHICRVAPMRKDGVPFMKK